MMTLPDPTDTTPLPTALDPDTTPLPTALVPWTIPVPTALVASPTMLTPLDTALPRAPNGLHDTLSFLLGVPPGPWAGAPFDLSSGLGCLAWPLAGW